MDAPGCDVLDISNYPQYPGREVCHSPVREGELELLDDPGSKRIVSSTACHYKWPSGLGDAHQGPVTDTGVTSRTISRSVVMSPSRLLQQ